MEESPNILYDKSIDIDDTLIYVLDDMIVNLGIVIELDLDTKMLKLKNKDQIVSFSIDSNGYIILKTDDYNIIDIENVESFQFDSLDDNIEISLTKDILPFIIPLSCISQNFYKQIYFIGLLEFVQLKL